MKRFIFVSLFLSIIFISIFVFPTVSAAPDFRQISQETVNFYTDFFQPILQALFGGSNYSGLLLFEKLLFFIILVSIIYLVIGKVPIFDGQKGVKWIIAIVVPLIGVRFINYDWMYSIITQYMVLSVVLTSLLPLVIYFFFIYGMGGDYSYLRKILWILFGLIYLGLWSTIDNSGQADIFIWTVVAAFFFAIADSKIYFYYLLQQQKSAGTLNRAESVARIREEIAHVQNLMRDGHMTPKDGEKIIKNKLKVIEVINRQ